MEPFTKTYQDLPSRTPDAPSFATLVRRHQAGVYRYLRVLGCEEHALSDLTQETLLLLLEKRFEWRSDIETAGWLRKCARNLFLSHCRKSGKVTLRDDLDLLEGAWQELVYDDDGEELLWNLRACMAKLAPRAQEALQLRYAESRNREEIAKELDLSPEGVKSLLSRSRNWLRECIERRRSGHGGTQDE